MVEDKGRLKHLVAGLDAAAKVGEVEVLITLTARTTIRLSMVDSFQQWKLESKLCIYISVQYAEEPWNLEKD